MEIDPFIFRLSIFILSIFIGYYVVWTLHHRFIPLMSVTNAISSVIIVVAIIAALAESSKFSVFQVLLVLSQLY